MAVLFVEAEPFVQFGRVHHEEHFEIILNSDQWFRICHLQKFSI